MSNFLKNTTMKKAFFSVILLLAASLALVAFAFPGKTNSTPSQEQPPALFPEDVQIVLENSCYGCHNDAASNVKAKSKLNFSKWSEYSDAKKVGKMESINDEIKGGKMPPEKFLANYPDKALSQEHKDLIDKWATEESAKLMGQ
jgi:hypothetical protein